jgi:hypothetical protein
MDAQTAGEALVTAQVHRVRGVDQARGRCHHDGAVPRLARSATSSRKPTDVPRSVFDVLRSPGQPLDEATRAWFEPRLGHDFRRVRLHTGATAAAAAQAVQARAYTVGRHIVFGSGAHPTTDRNLLAHELAHVVQQHEVADELPSRVELSSPGDALEREADRVAAQVTSPVSAAPHLHPAQRAPGTVPRVLYRQQQSTTADCFVDVRATYVQSWHPARHLFIVHRDAAGNLTAYRGQPERGLFDPRGPGGPIQTTIRPYRSGHPDWDPSAASTRVASGPDACNDNVCLARSARRIGALRLPYAGLSGPNSNTVVRAILRECNLPQRLPRLASGQSAPGWTYSPLP